MPKVYRVELTTEQQTELLRRTRDPQIRPRTRDRLEMIRLSNAGFVIPQIAAILKVSEQRVRHWIKAYLQGGFDALPDAPHSGKPPSLTVEMVEAIRAEIAKGARTWSAPQLADWLKQQYDLTIPPQHLSHRLKQAEILWKRTSRSLTHKQDPEAVAAEKAELDDLEKKGTWV